MTFHQLPWEVTSLVALAVVITPSVKIASKGTEILATRIGQKSPGTHLERDKQCKSLSLNSISNLRNLTRHAPFDQRSQY